MPNDRIKRAYRVFAYVVANVFLAFVALNAAQAAVDWARGVKQRWTAPSAPAPGTPAEGRVAPGPKRNPFQLQWFDRRAFGPEEASRVDRILDDFYTLGERGLAFQPYTQFSEGDFSGETLNVRRDAKGFEYRANGGTTAAGEDGAVFLLGGSTAFGYHVADDQTLGAALEKALGGRRVINYGKGYYYWFQELVLLERLLVAGHRPSAVVFVDGVNLPVKGEMPAFSDRLARLWDERQSGAYAPAIPGSLPLIRWINHAREARNAELFATRYPASAAEPVEAEAKRLVDSYRRTIDQARAAAAAVGAKAFFFWQPSRFHGCGYDGPVPDEYRETMRVIGALSEEMKKFSAPGYRYLGDLCRSPEAGAFPFVDRVHYSPKFNALIAREITSALRSSP